VIKTGESAEKSQRLAAALRENLKKRKMRQRALAKDEAAAPPQSRKKPPSGDEIGLSPDEEPR
jgi:hypothetical protein